MDSTTNLNLIPGDRGGAEFRNKVYWDKFFKTRGSKAFEWYGEYEALCGVLHKYIKLTDSVLMIGCGNSTLSERMYDVGIKNITNIDLSAVVIQQMQAKNRARKDMKWLKMDMLAMTEFEDATFDSCVDKGTLDALMSGDLTEKVNEDVDKLFNELDRVLKVGGRYVCISLAQDHILDKLLRSFTQRNWIIRVHRIDEQDVDFYLPVFVFSFTKMKIKMPNSIIEMKLEPDDEKFMRVSSLEEAKTKVKEYQNYGLTKFHISNRTVDIQDDVFVYLYDSTNQKYPRFTIYIVDTPSINKARMNGIFAVFVVPLGKEMEWLFSTKKGREELTSQAKYQRLAIVHLNRAHTYGSLDSIISELSPKVRDLAPKGIPVAYKIPLLSMGPEVDVRDLKFKGESAISGEFYVEDVTPSNASEPTRRLVFQSINPLIQTEAVLNIESVKKGSKKEKISKLDYNAFLEDYISMIMAPLYSVKVDPDQHLDMLIIGLGGGVLANYSKYWLKDSNIDAVEIDPKIAQVAKDWFGLVEDERCRVHIDDGLKFIDAASKANNKKWNVIVIDINSNDPNSDLWGPTNEFVEEEFLRKCKTILDKTTGILVINLLCLRDTLKAEIFARLNSVWKNIFVNKLPKNRNEIVFCSDQEFDGLFFKNAFSPAEKKNLNPNRTDGSSMDFLSDIYKSFKKLDLNKI